MTRSASQRRAFTLTELLVVIGLIVLLIALAVPAFSFLTGSRSVEGATNVLSSAFARARAEAIGIQSPRGVMIYRDVTTQRTVAQLVEVKTPGTLVNGRDYLPGDYILVGTNVYVCNTPHEGGDGTSSFPDRTPGSALDMSTDGADETGDDLWYQVGTTGSLGTDYIDIVSDRERLVMPVGVRVAGINNGGAYTDRSAIFFDGIGGLRLQTYSIPQLSLLGRTLQLGGTSTLQQSQIGLVAYDDTVARNAATSDGNPPDRFNVATTVFLNTGYTGYIEQNGTNVLVNRYNGTILAGQ